MELSAPGLSVPPHSPNTVPFPGMANQMWLGLNVAYLKITDKFYHIHRQVDTGTSDIGQIYFCSL